MNIIEFYQEFSLVKRRFFDLCKQYKNFSREEKLLFNELNKEDKLRKVQKSLSELSSKEREKLFNCLICLKEGK